VSVGELVDLLHRVAAHGAPTLRQIREQIRERVRERVRGRAVVRAVVRAVGNADETSWREAGRTGSIWGLMTPEGERYFAYEPSRAGALIHDLVGERFGGVLVTACYGGYNDTPGGQHQRCWGHLLRDVRALAETAQVLSREGLETRAWTAAVTALWQRVRTASTSPPTDSAVRVATYQTLLLEVQALGAQFLDQHGHPCRALAWRLWHFQLLTCVRQPAVPADTNAAARAIRPLVIARQISGGTRSPRGSQTRMALTTLVATWRASGCDPLAEFRRLLQAPLPQV
jgi:transposase